MKDSIQILCVGQHDLMMGAMLSLLARDPRYRETSRVVSPREALDWMAERPADVVLLDADAEEGRCFAVAQGLAEARPTARLVFFAASEEDPLIEQAISVGAVGFIRKEDLATSLLGVVREVAAGGISFPPQVLRRLIVSHSGLVLGQSPRPPRAD